MKRIKIVLFGIIIGLLLGLWVGVNIGRNKAFFSNPFVANSLKDKIRETGENILKKGGDVLENSGKAIKDSLSK